MNDSILVERAPVTVVTLNRPRRVNAVNLAMWRDLATLFRGFADDQSIRAVVLTGAGGHFSSGADISEFAALRDGAEASAEYEAASDEASRAIMALPKPVIAAIWGYCVGGGLALAMACDLRLADATATLGVPAARLGIVYGPLDTRNLLALVGLANAKRILFTAAHFDATAARSMGLIDELGPDPLVAAKALAAKIVANAPLSLAGAKGILQALAEGREDSAAIQALVDRAAASTDCAEGSAAFAAKRAPVFKGR
jgi:enoyl-CoA hydratase/carnithine racemase